MKNIKNQGSNGSGGGGTFSGTSTADLPEESPFLYLTSSNFDAIFKTHPDYLNAEKLFGVPLSGTPASSFQVLNYDGTNWNSTSNVILLDGSVKHITGSNPFVPDGTFYEKFTRIQKNAGNEDILTIPTNDGDKFVMELYVLGIDNVTNNHFFNSEVHFVENNSGTMNEDFYYGYSDAEYTRTFVGTDLIIRLNTPNSANVSIKIKIMTAEGNLSTPSFP